jgi:hypothetical protein
MKKVYRVIKAFLVASLLLVSLFSLAEDDSELLKAIQAQVISANDCEVLAYSMTLKNLDSDEVFRDCVERRALLIAMQRKYGPGKYGEIDVFDKIEAYSFLEESSNKRVQHEASSFSTAAGGD